MSADEIESEPLPPTPPQPLPPTPPPETETTPSVNLSLPGSLIPMAGANAMLIVGSNKNNCDCSFPLHWFLVIGGAIGLCLVVMDVLAQYIVDWVLEDKKITRIEKFILIATRTLGFVLTLIQISALIVGTYFILATVSCVEFTDEGKGKDLKKTCLDNLQETKEQDLWAWNKNSDEVYCDYAMYMFTACLVAMTWTFVLLGLLCFLYIWYGRQNLKKFNECKMEN